MKKLTKNSANKEATVLPTTELTVAKNPTPEEWITALSEADRIRLDAAVDAAASNWMS